jgi:hypothetical protein
LETTVVVTKLLYLDKIGQYRTTNGSFKWKLIEDRLKTNKDEGKLGDERYQVVAFAIFGLVLFRSEAGGIISVEATNTTITILVKTFISLNHYRLHGKGCNMMLYSFVVHIGGKLEAFNNFWWFNMRPLKLVVSED